MKVISLKNTKKLVKGTVYEVSYLRNKKPTNGGFFRPVIVIKNMCRSTPNSFTLENGNPIPEIDYTEASFNNTNSYIRNPENIKIGDILKCRRQSVYLEFGNLYRVDDVKILKKTSWYDVSIKVGGYDRWLSIYGFILPSQEELRDISISQILGDKKINLKIDKENRIIDRYDIQKKNRVLTSILFRSILDTHRNTLDILDWAIQKIEPKFKLTREDFSEIMEKSVYEICLENEKSQFQ
jgi:hypothetical protein